MAEEFVQLGERPIRRIEILRVPGLVGAEEFEHRQYLASRQSRKIAAASAGSRRGTLQPISRGCSLVRSW